MIEVDLTDRVHWVLYRTRLPLRFRYENHSVRAYYREFEADAGGDVQDHGWFAQLKTLPFASVTWEDSGLRQTIFDPYDVHERAQRVAELEQLLSGHLANLANEVLLRTELVDPRLKDTLHAGFKTFERIQTPEDIAQVAISCRRFIQGLADALYAPRSEPVDGRNVGPDAYRNRLWAYVKEQLSTTEGKVVLAELSDVGTRLDRLDDLINKGLHRSIPVADLRRLILGLVLLAYDLLTLAPPPTSAPTAPYAENVTRIAKDVVRWHTSRE
jgi:hypothetical protein